MNAPTSSHLTPNPPQERSLLVHVLYVVLLLITFAAVSQLRAAIVAGDISIIGYNATNPDEFRIVFLSSATAGDTLNFTDNGWTSSGAFRTGEGVLTYTVPTGGLTAGTTVNWLNGQTITGTGWNSNNPANFAFNASGDSLIAYTGTSTLVYALQQGTTWDANSTSASTSSEPTSTNGGTLVSGVTTNAFGNINGYYSGAMTTGTKTLLQVATANATNWTTTTNTGGAISDTNFKSSFTVGSSASLYWDANGTTAGTGGTGTWDATTNNMFKSAAADSGISSFRWVNSTSGNDHSAVFAGTAGTVSVATGGVTASGLQFDATGYTIQSNTITLSGSTPTGTVTNAGDTATISSTLAGSTSFTKAGAGTLVLSSPYTYTGTTTVSAGTLSIVSQTLASTNPITVSSGAFLTSTGTLKFNGNSTSTYSAIAGAGTLNLRSTTSNASTPDISFNDNDANNVTTNWGTRIATNIDLGSSQRYIWGKTNHSSFSQYGATSDVVMSGSISGSGGMTFIAQNNYTSTNPMEVPFVLSGANTFSGTVEVQRGSVYLNNASALTQSNVLSFTPTTGNNARFFLYGNSTTVTNLQSSGAGTALIANGNSSNPNGSTALNAATLTVNQTSNSSFGGSIVNGQAEYDSGLNSPGALSLVKTGASTLTLNGASTYSGGTTIQAGQITAGNATALGTGSVTINNASTGINNTSLQLSSGVSISNTITVANQGTGIVTLAASGTAIAAFGGGIALNKSITVNNTNSFATFTGGQLTNGGLNITGSITGTGGVTFTGGQVTRLATGTNTYSGQTTITGNSVLYLWNAVSSSQNSSYQIDAGSYLVHDTLTSGGGGKLGGLTGAGTLQASSNGTSNIQVGYLGNTDTFSGTVAGATNFNKQGTGTQIFTGTNTYTGTTTITSGTLQIGNAGTTGTLGSGAVTNNATLNFNRTDSYGGAVSNAISGTGAVSLTQGTLSLTGANTYSGGTTLSAGRLNINNGTAGSATSSAIGTGAFTITGGSIDATVSGIVLGTNNVLNLNGDFSFAGTNDLNLGTGNVNLNANRLITVDAGTLTIGGNITSAAFTISKQGNGTLKLTGSNAYTGATTLSSGVLSVSSVASLGTGTAAVSISGDSNLQYTGAGGTLTKPVTVTSGTGTISNTGGGTLDLNGTLTKSGTILKLTGGTFSVSGQITGSAANSDLVVDNATVTLTNTTNDYNGPTIIQNSGKVIMAGDHLGIVPASTTAGNVVLNNGTLNTTADVTLDAKRGLAVGPTSGSGSGTLEANTSTTLTVNGVVANNGGTGSLTKAGVGNVTLTAANTYSGGTSITAGTLQLGSSGTTGDASSGDIVVSSGATLKTSRSDTLTLAQAITGAGNLDVSHTSAGTTILSKVTGNSYSGTTTVNSGTLLANNTSGSATGTSTVSVNGATAVLGGTGTIGGATTVTLGQITPGTAALTGKLTFGNAVTLDGTSAGTRLALRFGASGVSDLNDAANIQSHLNDNTYMAWILTQASTYEVTTGGTHDRLSVDTLNLSSGGQIVVDNSAGYSPQFGDVFNLLDWTTFNKNSFNLGSDANNQRAGGLIGDLNLPGLASGLTYDLSLFNATGASGIVVVVPEPSRAVLVILAVVSLTLRRRR